MIAVEKEKTDIIKQLCDIYRLEGEITGIEPVLTGHINETLTVTMQNGGTENTYVFQKLNNFVFKEPIKIMRNIELVNKWLLGRMNCPSENDDSICMLLSFIHNKHNCNYTILDDGSFWRVSVFVPDSVTFEAVENADMMEKTGRAFGNFQRMLSGMPLDGLEETIPDFHNTKKRIADLFEIVNKDPVSRAGVVADEIKFFREYRKDFAKLDDMRSLGELPLRVIHNDTKCNNILFSRKTNEPLAVIDLDTLMPGLSAHDFGDAIRCAANRAAEDETDLDKVGLNLEYYESFARGFMNEAKNFLTANEAAAMALGAPTIAFELASRFLADYIDGDRYFRIHHEGHNLERARCQIKLCQDMIDKYDIMRSIVEKYCS